MSTVPNFKDIAWGGGPRSSARLADWQAAVGRPLEELSAPNRGYAPVRPDPLLTRFSPPHRIVGLGPR